MTIQGKRDQVIERRSPRHDEFCPTCTCDSAAQALSAPPDEALRWALERAIDLYREAFDYGHAFMPKDDRIEARENNVRPLIRALAANERQSDGG